MSRCPVVSLSEQRNEPPGDGSGFEEMVSQNYA
jgi:hypothetical protein